MGRPPGGVLSNSGGFARGNSRQEGLMEGGNAASRELRRRMLAARLGVHPEDLNENWTNFAGGGEEEEMLNQHGMVLYPSDTGTNPLATKDSSKSSKKGTKASSKVRQRHSERTAEPPLRRPVVSHYDDPFNDQTFDDYNITPEHLEGIRGADRDRRLAQSAMEKIEQARYQGQASVNLTQDELLALERQRRGTPVNILRSQHLATPPPTPPPARSSKVSSKENKPQSVSNVGRRGSLKGFFGGISLSPSRSPQRKGSPSREKVSRKGSMEKTHSLASNFYEQQTAALAYNDSLLYGQNAMLKYPMGSSIPTHQQQHLRSSISAESNSPRRRNSRASGSTSTRPQHKMPPPLPPFTNEELMAHYYATLDQHSRPSSSAGLPAYSSEATNPYLHRPSTPPVQQARVSQHRRADSPFSEAGASASTVAKSAGYKYKDFLPHQVSEFGRPLTPPSPDLQAMAGGWVSEEEEEDEDREVVAAPRRGQITAVPRRVKSGGSAELTSSSSGEDQGVRIEPSRRESRESRDEYKDRRRRRESDKPRERSRTRDDAGDLHATRKKKKRSSVLKR